MLIIEFFDVVDLGSLARGRGAEVRLLEELAHDPRINAVHRIGDLRRVFEGHQLGWAGWHAPAMRCPLARSDWNAFVVANKAQTPERLVEN